MGGALISFDGLDSSGKATQVKRLQQTLEDLGKRVVNIETPDYTTSSGKELKARLQGKLGSWANTPWQEKMGYFATNRAEHRQEVLDTLGGGDIVLYDRYVPSSLVFMEVEADVGRADVHKAVEETEYLQNGMPREAFSLFLDVPPKVADQLLSGRKGERQDEDEYTDQLEIQQRMHDAYLRLADEQPERMVRIACMDGQRLRTPDEIAELVWQVVEARLHL